MQSRLFTLALLLAVAASAPALAQSGSGALYAFHSRPIGGCPGLDWHVTLEPDNALVGFVAWDGGKHMARLNGMINNNRAFQLQAQEVGGQARSAVVKGTASGDYINAAISGSGTACDDKPLSIPRVVGGIGGGGG